MKETESIFSGKNAIIPMADVQHIEKHRWPSEPEKVQGYQVITKHTRWDSQMDFWANSIYLPFEEGENFLKAWCTYRSEIEADTLADLSPKAQC